MIATKHVSYISCLGSIVLARMSGFESSSSAICCTSSLNAIKFNLLWLLAAFTDACIQIL